MQTTAPASAARYALREALARHRHAIAHLESFRAPLARLEAAAAAEREAEGALAALEAAEEARLRAWAETGAGSMPAPDTKAREAAERRLSAARATAAAARAAGERLNADMQVAAQEVADAAAGLREPELAVVLEAAEVVAAEYRDAVERAAAIWGQLVGLDHYIESHLGDLRIVGPSGGARMAGIRFDRRDGVKEFPALGFDLDVLGHRAVIAVPVPSDAIAAGQERARAALAAATSDGEG